MPPNKVTRLQIYGKYLSRATENGQKTRKENKMKEFLRIMCEDMDREGFTAMDYLVYGLLGPGVLFAVLVMAEALA